MVPHVKRSIIRLKFVSGLFSNVADVKMHLFLKTKNPIKILSLVELFLTFFLKILHRNTQVVWKWFDWAKMWSNIHQIFVYTLPQNYAIRTTSRKWPSKCPCWISWSPWRVWRTSCSVLWLLKKSEFASDRLSLWFSKRCEPTQRYCNESRWWFIVSGRYPVVSQVAAEVFLNTTIVLLWTISDYVL